MPYLTRCDDCLYIFKSHNQVNKHAAATGHTPGRFTYICLQCLPVQTFLDRAAARAHKEATGHLRGPQPVPTSTGRPPLPACPECEASFTTEDQLAAVCFNAISTPLKLTTSHHIFTLSIVDCYIAMKCPQK